MNVYTSRQILQPLPDLPPISSLLARAPFDGPLLPLDPLRSAIEPHYYAENFTALLSLVLQAQVEEMEKALIHMVPLHVHDQSGGTYRLHIPGIREDSPRLTIGDRLILRGLYLELRLAGSVAVEAEVVGLVKAKGWVYARAPHLADVDASLPKIVPKGEDGPGSAMYQVEFRVSAAPLCTMQDAVSTLRSAINFANKVNSYELSAWRCSARRSAEAHRELSLIDGYSRRFGM